MMVAGGSCDGVEDAVGGELGLRRMMVRLFSQWTSTYCFVCCGLVFLIENFFLLVLHLSSVWNVF